MHLCRFIYEDNLSTVSLYPAVSKMCPAVISASSAQTSATATECLQFVFMAACENL